MLPDESVLASILSAGLLAPSAENHHYLRFRKGADSVQLLSTDHDAWTAFPHRKMLGLLAFGAVVENVDLASAAIGLQMSIAAWPDASRPALIAVLRWEPASAAAVPDPLFAVVGQRHTNRRFYRRTRPEPALVTALARATETVPGTALRWLDEPASRSAALRVIRLAETERFRRPELHAELFGAIRFNLGWHRTSNDWLPPGALEVEPPMRPLFSQLRHWPLMHAATWVGTHVLLGLRAGYLPCATAPHLGLILAAGDSEALANLNAGRALQRAWLAATSVGLAFQPMAAATALARQHPGGGWVSKATSHKLRQGLEGLVAGSVNQRPYMLFRTGLAAAPTLTTQRLPLADHLD